MRLRGRVAILCIVLSALQTGCSIVTVPVKAVGSLAETVVTTTGDIVTAPFHAGDGDGKANAQAGKEASSSAGGEAEK